MSPVSTAATWVALGGIVFIALLFGYVASKGDAVLIAMTVAGVAGIALLARPVWIIWVTMALGLLVVGLVPLWADEAASKAVWAVSILGFAALLAALLRAVADTRTVANTPAFVWLVLVFISYASINSILQLTTPMDFIGGFKRYFSMYGLIFCLAWLPIGDELMARWRRFLLVVALVQFPWALYQLVELVPIRRALNYAHPDMVPVDVVAGTFGASLTRGGSSGEMTAFLICTMAFLLARMREKLIPKGIFAWLVLIIMIPLSMGETKVVLVILPLMLLSIYRKWLTRNPINGTLVILLGVLLTIVLGFAYVRESGLNINQWIKSSLAYNFGNVGLGGYSLNRTTSIIFWFSKQGFHDPLSAVFGNGLGAAMESTIPPGYIARRYFGYGVGLNALSSLLWEQGIVGCMIFLSIFVAAWRSATQLMQRAKESWVRADAAAIQSTLPIIVVWLAYDTALIDQVPFQIVFACYLGYLAWLCRRGNILQNVKA